MNAIFIFRGNVFGNYQIVTKKHMGIHVEGGTRIDIAVYCKGEGSIPKFADGFGFEFDVSAKASIF